MHTKEAYPLVMDCYMALNNLLPGPVDDQLKPDKLSRLIELHNAYASLVDAGFMNTGEDPFAGSPIEYKSVIASSNARLIAELSWRAIESVLTLVCKEGVCYDRFGRTIREEHLARLKRYHGRIARAAATLVSQSELARISELFQVEMEVKGASIEQRTNERQSMGRVDFLIRDLQSVDSVDHFWTLLVESGLVLAEMIRDGKIESDDLWKDRAENCLEQARPTEFEKQNRIDSNRAFLFSQYADEKSKRPRTIRHIEKQQGSAYWLATKWKEDFRIQGKNYAMFWAELIPQLKHEKLESDCEEWSAPMSKREVLNYIGRPAHAITERQAMKWLNDSIDGDELRSKKKTRKSFYWHLGDIRRMQAKTKV